MTWWYDDMMVQWHDDTMLWWYDDMMMRCYDDMMIWWYDDMMVRWYDGMTTWWYDDMMIRCYDDMMIRWYNDMMVRWHDDTMVRWHDDTIVRWHDDTVAIWWCHDYDETFAVLPSYSRVVFWILAIECNFNCPDTYTLYMMKKHINCDNTYIRLIPSDGGSSAGAPLPQPHHN